MTRNQMYNKIQALVASGVSLEQASHEVRSKYKRSQAKKRLEEKRLQEVIEMLPATQTPDDETIESAEDERPVTQKALPKSKGTKSGKTAK